MNWFKRLLFGPEQPIRQPVIVRPSEDAQKARDRARAKAMKAHNVKSAKNGVGQVFTDAEIAKLDHK